MNGPEEDKISSRNIQQTTDGLVDVQKKKERSNSKKLLTFF